MYITRPWNPSPPAITLKCAGGALGKGGQATDTNMQQSHWCREKKDEQLTKCLWTSFVIVFLALPGSFTRIQNLEHQEWQEREWVVSGKGNNEEWREGKEADSERWSGQYWLDSWERFRKDLLFSMHSWLAERKKSHTRDSSEEIEWRHLYP